ncbi:hypothetical protein DCAR_0417906 [Daucus carota subsp. sativus]|uniref:Uncharacterized protein n=1 Tax=Daucus carota subsp. sativus TaxID=79200 RepID=A0A165Z0H5_DAUCS|nr:PREDICTED: transcription factor TGA1-like [Daucus carota subsp. sativus]XP_017243504.1 PREDICTED: transcription factor TGA1-like [Daucus carota subsp. sativus]WOG98562.1 hypothetical protein DCAR_0417906 [Daucus carota subsp. sativus]
MASPSTQFATTRRMGMYDPLHHISTWEDILGAESSVNITSSCTILQADTRLLNKSYTSQESLGELSDNQAGRTKCDKLQRRLAQNREAARKSRLRKKAYVQQLETSRLKLAQLELEIDRTKQGLYTGGAGHSGTINSGIISFEIEYGLWVELQEKKNCQLRNVLQAQISEKELRVHVEGGLAHFSDLFRMKAEAAKADVFHVMHGMYRSPLERLFLWIGGFKPSEVIQILVPQLEPLTEQQLVDVYKLRHSCQQAEDALSQGMEKLVQTLAQCVVLDNIAGGSYGSRMASAMERLESLECFMNQADHLRQQTLQQMSRILTTSQAARGLLAFGEYFQRLRALSSLWAVHPHL